MGRKLGGLRSIHDPSLLAKSSGANRAPIDAAHEAVAPLEEPEVSAPLAAPAPVEMEQIENHKENILPISKGRKASSISRAFGTSIQSKESLQRYAFICSHSCLLRWLISLPCAPFRQTCFLHLRAFEDELRDSISDDPIEIWTR